MKRLLLWLALVVGLGVPTAAGAQATMGYDAHGRLICVYHPTSTPKITRYVYDAAGNRTSRTVLAASGQTCGSQPVGPPPALPVTLTNLDPSSTLASDATQAWLMGVLGNSSDSATLTLLSAATSGGTGSCGTSTVTATTLSYVAPTLNPAGASLTCYIDYVFQHPNSQQKTGRVTLTITGVDPPGGPGDPGDWPPPEGDPRSECNRPPHTRPEYCNYPPPNVE